MCVCVSFAHRLRRGQRLYRHFAFKFAPSPPFQVTHISDELPLHNNMTHKVSVVFSASRYSHTVGVRTVRQRSGSAESAECNSFHVCVCLCAHCVVLRRVVCLASHSCVVCT